MKNIISRQEAIDLILVSYNEEGIFDTITLQAMKNKELANVLNFEMKELESKTQFKVIKDFLISRRLENGWDYKLLNKSHTHCDVDGAKLWIAPHGGIYCDLVHKK